MNCDHVNGQGATIAWIGDVVAPNSEPYAIGTSFLMLVDAHVSVRDVLSLFDGYVVSSHEDDCIGSFALAGHTWG